MSGLKAGDVVTVTKLDRLGRGPIGTARYPADRLSRIDDRCRWC
jgi:DNA invertase Pin-like site-specific DNA recombinase